MRAYLFAVAALPLALAGCGAAGTASKSSSTPVSQVKASTTLVTIKVLSVMTSSQAHKASPKGTSIGDNVTFEDVLLNVGTQFGKNANAQVGSDSGKMTFTGAHSARMEGVTTLPGGTISFSGDVIVLPNNRLVVPIVGGTGQYANASGTLLVGTGSKRSPNTYRLILAGAAGPVA